MVAAGDCDHGTRCRCYSRPDRRKPQRLSRLPLAKQNPRRKNRMNVAGLLPASDWRTLRQACLARPNMGSGSLEPGPCERCGRRRATDPHHRLTVARGGPDVLSNLAALCRECHDHVHRYEHEARLGGWILPSGADFRTRAILRWDDMIALLDDEGGYAFLGLASDAPDDAFPPSP